MHNKYYLHSYPFKENMRREETVDHQIKAVGMLFTECIITRHLNMKVPPLKLLWY